MRWERTGNSSSGKGPVIALMDFVWRQGPCILSLFEFTIRRPPMEYFCDENLA